MYSIMEKKPKARNMESTTRISVMAAGEASDIESAAVVPTGSPKYFGPRNANRAAGSTSSAGLTGDASFQIVSILKFFLRRILAEVWTSTAPMPENQGGSNFVKREQKRREADRTASLLRAPHVEALKKSPFTLELLTQCRAIGHGQRILIQLTWLGRSLWRTHACRVENRIVSTPIRVQENPASARVPTRHSRVRAPRAHPSTPRGDRSAVRRGSRSWFDFGKCAPFFGEGFICGDPDLRSRPCVHWYLRGYCQRRPLLKSTSVGMCCRSC